MSSSAALLFSLISFSFCVSAVLSDIVPGKQLIVSDNKWRNRDPVRLEDILFGVDVSAAGNSQCHHEIDLIWKAQLGSTCDSTPVISDIGNDGKKEIAISTMEHYIEVIHGEDGHKVSGWPFAFARSRFQANPLLYDFDKDGKQDIVVSTLDGEVVFIRESGYPFYGSTLKVPPLRVRKDWFDGLDSKDVAASFTLHGQSEPAAPPKGGRKLNSLPEDPVSLNETQRSRSRRLLAEEEDEEEDEGTIKTEAIWQGLEGWLPQEGVESLELFLPTETPPSYVVQLHNNMDPLRSYQYEAYLAGKEEKERRDSEPKMVDIDAHILASPVIIDLDGDGEDEIIIPVSYYFDTEDYMDPQVRKERSEINDIDLSKYVAGGITVFSIANMTHKFTVPLDLTTDTNVYRGYIYASPTVVDFDGDSKLEIVIGTGVGLIYVIGHDGVIEFGGFPQMMDAIYNQVIAEDVNGDGEIELIVTDINSNIACFNRRGEELWENRVSGVVNQPPTLGDITGTGKLSVIVTTDAGHVWAYAGDTGKVIENFPIKLRGPIYAQPLLLPFDTLPQIVVPAHDGFLYIIDAVSGCVDQVDIGEASYAMALADDLIGNGNMDLLVTTKSGNVYCLETTVPYHPLKAWVSQGPFTQRYNWHGIYIVNREQVFISGQTFPITFEIVDKRPHHKSALYQIKITLMGSVMFTQNYTEPGFYTVTLPSPTVVLTAAPLVLEMKNEFAQQFYDSMPVSCNVFFAKTLKWVLILPFISMAFVLLFIKELDSIPLPLIGKRDEGHKA